MKKLKIHLFRLFALSGRHLVVSGLCATVEYSLFLFLIQTMGASLTVSYLTAYFLATTIGYIGHNYFTFKIGSISLPSILRFAMQSITSLSVGYLLLRIFLRFNIPVWISKALQLACTFIFNIAFGKYVTFRRYTNS